MGADHGDCSHPHSKAAPKSHAVMDDDNDMTQARAPRKRRKTAKDSLYDDDNCETKSDPKERSNNAKKDDGEKRLKRHRAKQPVAYGQLLERAITQRMFVLDRKPTGTADQPEQVIDLAGSTGNVYQVVIGKVPTCTCPYARKGHSECKHIVYVLHRTLKAPAHVAYQLAFLTSELVEIFAHAPPIPTGKAEDNHGNRKPIDDDCPICCDEFDAANEEIVYCKAACGNNVHRVCFEKWAAQKSSTGMSVTCPFCRSPWESDAAEIKKIVDMGSNLNHEGYVNVGAQLGLSGERGKSPFDYSTYHPHWVASQGRGSYYF